MRPNMYPTIYPYLRYRDAKAAIAFLCDVFGFRRVMIAPGSNGGIAHAELAFGNGMGDNGIGGWGMVMLGDGDGGSLAMQPRGAVDSGGIYVVSSDIDALYARVQQAGASIVMALHDTDYGSRDFTCRDLEGFLWSFGTYQPDFDAKG